jgi:hypothetical protein
MKYLKRFGGFVLLLLCAGKYVNNHKAAWRYLRTGK